METNVNYTAVGAFVIVLFTFIIITTIWLSSGFSVGHYAEYQVNMNESVAGLNVDSVVEYNGVDVGTVKSIAIDHHNPQLVVLILGIKNTTPITRGTRAILTTKGLTGVAFMSLIDKGNDLTPLLALPGQEYPVIQSSPSFLGRLDTTLHKLTESVTKVAASVEALMTEENLRAVREILIDMKHVSRTLAMNSNQIDTLLHNWASASARLPALIQSGTDTMHVLRAQILPATNQAMMNIDMITHNLADVAIEAKKNPAVFLRGKEPPKLGPGE